MPLEIKELHVKVMVNPEGGSNAPQTSAGRGQSSNGGGNSPQSQSELVQTIIDKIMEILEEKMER
jgi:hypothetical protein